MSQTIGEQLRLARGIRQITLEQAAKATHIRQGYLEALENEQWDNLPSKVQGRGFLRIYADYLGLDPDHLLNPIQPSSDLPDITPPNQPAETETTADQSSETDVTAFQEPESEVEPALSTDSSKGNIPVFAEIGQTLRQRRESISLSIADVERYTRLRARYLQALEEGRIYDLPSPVQGRGMLSNYAAFLGLNSEEILNRFAEGLQNRLAVSRAGSSSTTPPKTRKKASSGWRRFISMDVLVGSTLILGLLAFAIWNSAQIAAQQGAKEPTPPSVSDVLLDTRTPQTQYTPVSSTTPQATIEIQATATIPIQGNKPLQVYIISRQRVWLKVIEDGKVAFTGRTAPSTAYPFSAINQLEVYSGSAVGLQIYFNQTEFSQPGRLGEPLQLIFTAQGIVTPTPLFTPTPSATPQPTATLQPTRTQGAPTITPLIP